ncbi:hypothetical protein [Clostridiisalibacter paucivorans]|uniref:hypothetical protein n=1 Tax=Clostridiisalibacter paucivorans TaxID=408753 RepID=UPI0006874FE2|nr:hypothetical protein [Clostridiisalibacter paucivorans]
MKNKFLAILGAAVITVGAIGGVAFASNFNNGSIYNRDTNMMGSRFNETNRISNNDFGKRHYNQQIDRPSEYMHSDMIRIMRDNDAVRHMETDNYNNMTEYMNNMSQEDYDEMIEIMNDNDYQYMGEMMESIDRDEMTRMHNSMGRMHGRGHGSMMGRW